MPSASRPPFLGVNAGVLGPSTDPSSELWVLHPSTRHASARVNVFMRSLKNAFPGEWL
jgi:hypothetical protein